MSSTKSEYIALSLASKEGIWLCQFFMEVGYKEVDVQWLTIYSDTKPAISLTVNLDHHFYMKHINIPFHFVREQIQKGIISIEYVLTKKIPTDGLTKPLTNINFSCFVSARIADFASIISHNINVE